MHIGIYRDQFTVSDALALYMLRKHDDEWELQEIIGDDVSELDMYIRDGNICINTSKEGREEVLTKAQTKLTAAVAHLKTDILQLRPVAKLTPAGVAYALSCVADLEAEIRGIFAETTEKALRMDISFIYEATVEVVDTEYWHAALPSLSLELKYPTSQKEDFLVRVREISELLSNRISALGNEIIENGAENGAQNDAENGDKNGAENGAKNGAKNGDKNGAENGAKNGAENGAGNGAVNGVGNAATFLSIAEDTINLIGLEYENVVNWFFCEWVAINYNVWHGLNNRFKTHHTGVIMFIQPTRINNDTWTHSIMMDYIKKLRDFQESPLSFPIMVHLSRLTTHLTEASAVKLMILKGTVVRATGQRFLLPTEWNVNGSVLSSEIEVPGIISIAHSRDHAITETFESAYNLAIKALKKSSEATDWTPTDQNIVNMKRVSNKVDRLLTSQQLPENPEIVKQK
ncbi:hypothetical protein DdX_14560 [Ditylenchus destructor]|uniref:Uncharacterized protein n=1 Tax=Ditylenchus destructor TaxID=166010 RepID=A0AAD4MWJ7_9BILA|nr:hypothetical protein DdX_14560 [Ditylenchus destructor]